MGFFAEDDEAAEIEQRMAHELQDPRAMRNDLVKAKHDAAAADEWARIDELKAQQADEKDAAKRAVNAERQDVLRAGLEAQKAGTAARKAAEFAESRGWAVELQRQGQEHRSKQVASRAKAAAAVEDLKAKREQQLDEHQSAKDRATAAKQKDEAAEAAVVAQQEYEQKQKADRSAAKAKTDLQMLTVANQERRAMKDTRKEEQRNEDRAFMEENARVMDAQDAKRGSQKAAVQARQNAQAVVAQSLPESKRWLDPELIDRYAREREESAGADEARRKAAVSNGRVSLQTALDAQMAEHTLGRNQRAADKVTERAGINSTIQANEALDQADRDRHRAKQAAFKQMLDEQVKDNIASKAGGHSAMSRVEKGINADLLRRAPQV